MLITIDLQCVIKMDSYQICSANYTRKSGIIVGAMAIEGNIYDDRTLKSQLEKVKELTEGKKRRQL